MSGDPRRSGSHHGQPGALSISWGGCWYATSQRSLPSASAEPGVGPGFCLRAAFFPSGPSLFNTDVQLSRGAGRVVSLIPHSPPLLIFYFICILYLILIHLYSTCKYMHVLFGSSRLDRRYLSSENKLLLPFSAVLSSRWPCFLMIPLPELEEAPLAMVCRGLRGPTGTLAPQYKHTHAHTRAHRL